MRGNITLLVAVIASLCFVGSTVQAATVHIELMDYLDGTFEIYGSASMGDNGGISFYNIPLVNYLAVSHKAPRALDADTGYVRGFTVGYTEILLGNAVFAGQDTSSRTTNSLIFGIGQAAGSYNTLTPFKKASWNAPVLIASGTCIPKLIDFGPERDLMVNVFTTVGDFRADCAKVTTHVTRISDEVITVPEPNMLALMGLASVYLAFGLKRRLG